MSSSSSGRTSDIDIHSKEQPFYISLSQHPPTNGFRGLLENYSKIPASKIDAHIESIREEAWSHYPYPSIGLFLFLDLGLSGDDLPSTSPSTMQTITSNYQEILHRLENGGRFLDAGCMLSQDSRKLIYDGAAPSSVYGTDLRGEYFEYGYKLFKDEEIIPREQFIEADILDENGELKGYESFFDVINSTHLIHVFSLEDQKVLIKRMIRLLKKEKGVIVTGRMTGHLESGYRNGENAKSTTKEGKAGIWEHNPESFEKLWREVTGGLGERWRVDCWFWRFGIHTGMGREGWFREE